MIRLEISNTIELKNNYLAAVMPEVLADLEYLKNTLSHFLNPQSINFNDFKKRWSANALVIKNILGLNGFPDKPFIKKNYSTSASIIYNAPNKEAVADLSNILDLVNHLINSRTDLENILVGTAEELQGANTRLMNDYSIILDGELEILKLGFRYWDSNGIGNLIRNFSKVNQLTKFCPYCNIEAAFYSKNHYNNHDVTRFDLDHFYDKARYPLLSVSLFNLVPSGQICNQVNKGTTHFTDQYHLNPFVDGFGQDMKFVPIMDPLTLIVTEIDLKLKNGLSQERTWKILGTGLHNAELTGNINAFQLHAKYNDEGILEDASSLLHNIRSTINNLQSLTGLLGSADVNNQQLDLQGWFEKISYSKFHPKDYGQKARSKFNRDLLDYYCNTQSSEGLLGRVKEILKQSYTM